MNKKRRSDEKPKTTEFNCMKFSYNAGQPEVRKQTGLKLQSSGNPLDIGGP